MKLVESEAQHEQAKGKLSDAINKLLNVEKTLKERDRKTHDGNASSTQIFQQEIQDLKEQLVSEDEQLDIETSKAKACQGKLISSEREKNEAMQVQVATEMRIQLLTEVKDAEIARLLSKLEEGQKLEEKQKELLRRTQGELGDLQRTVNELQNLLKTNEALARKHYCNATLIREDIVAYSITMRKSFRRKLDPLLDSARKESKKLLARARVRVERIYKTYVFPNTKKVGALAVGMYESHAKEHLERHVQPLYEKHLALHVSKFRLALGEVQKSLYLFSLSSVKDTSRVFLNEIESRKSYGNKGKESEMKSPDWLIQTLQFTEKNAPELVQVSFFFLRWLVVLLLCRPFLHLVLRILCLPFSILGLLIGRNMGAAHSKTRTHAKGKPQIMKV